MASHVAAAGSAPSSFPLVESLNGVLSSAQDGFMRVPGSAIVLRYVRSSYQNDPIRSLLELILVIFALRTILQSRTRGNSSSSNFVKLTEKVRRSVLALRGQAVRF